MQTLDGLAVFLKNEIEKNPFIPPRKAKKEREEVLMIKSIKDQISQILPLCQHVSSLEDGDPTLLLRDALYQLTCIEGGYEMCAMYAQDPRTAYWLARHMMNLDKVCEQLFKAHALINGFGYMPYHDLRQFFESLEETGIDVPAKDKSIFKEINLATSHHYIHRRNGRFSDICRRTLSAMKNAISSHTVPEAPFPDEILSPLHKALSLLANKYMPAISSQLQAIEDELAADFKSSQVTVIK